MFPPFFISFVLRMFDSCIDRFVSGFILQSAQAKRPVCVCAVIDVQLSLLSCWHCGEESDRGNVVGKSECIFKAAD